MHDIIQLKNAMQKESFTLLLPDYINLIDLINQNGPNNRKSIENLLYSNHTNLSEYSEGNNNSKNGLARILEASRDHQQGHGAHKSCILRSIPRPHCPAPVSDTSGSSWTNLHFK